jgi:methyl-accepting chemotaxis protein
MPSIPYINKPILTARDAIASHVRWKITLLMATRMREPLSQRATHAIQHTEECSISKWLLSRHTLHLRGTPEYRAVLDRHAEFHREMQAIARLINAADYASAERLLNAPAAFQLASIAVANAIMALDSVPAPALAL